MGHLVPVKIVKEHGQSALVEWREGNRPRRCYVPRAVVEDGACDSEELEYGIPYGVDWSEVFDLRATPRDLELALHNAGIWTADDLQQRSQAAFGALQAVYGVDLAKMLQVARSLKE